ncbi:MAG: VOC family protein [Cyanobacteria bacterium J06626_26]
MKIDHIHFFVEDAAHQRNWFVTRLGWTFVKQATLLDRHLEVLRYRDTLFVLSSPRTSTSPVAQYLRTHGPGVADVAIEVENLAVILRRLEHHPNLKPQALGCRQNQPKPTTAAVLSQLASPNNNLGNAGNPPLTWTTIAGWGGLCHTLIERRPLAASSPGGSGLDHIVLNVPMGELQAAVTFYQTLFELQKQQSFNIQTEQSGLGSQVLFDPASQLYFNINQPTSANSQIQTFLDANRGAGIQHIALHSEPIVPTVTALRRRGVPLLSVPLTYYNQLQRRLQADRVDSVSPQEWQQIVKQQILIDWQPQKTRALLLQIFSQPIFQAPTFFLSLLSVVGLCEALVRATFWLFTKQLKQKQRGSADPAWPQKNHHDPTNPPQRLPLEWQTATVF